MQEKQNQKKKVMILVLVLGLVLLTIGGTYAFFTYSKQGVEEHVLTTGSLYFVYDELPNAEDSNKISIGNAFPVSDENGIQQDKPGMFEFEVRAKTQGADINYEIYLTKDESSTLPEKVVDTYLTTTGKKGENAEESLVTPNWDNKWKKDNGAVLYQFLWNSHVPVLEDGQQGKSLYQETINDTEGQEYSKIFRYRMWLDESAEGVNAKGEWIYGEKSFTVRVNVYASNEELPAPTPVGVMQSWTYVSIWPMPGAPEYPELDFHTYDYANSISNISFINKIEKPKNTTEEWDISEKQDKSVMAYMIPNQEETCQNLFENDEPIQCNDIVIASNGDTYGNSDSSELFKDFQSVKTIDFTNYNTILVENMSQMFESCGQLESLDLSGWDTSSVTDMFGMFENCSQLTSTGNLDKWNTSSVTDMSAIFNGCNALIDLSSISNWVTSSVTDMDFIFSGCQLTTLDLSGWDTSNVTNMGSMFSGCNQLSTINGINTWNTSNVTDMSYMFNGCSELTELDISNFDFSSIDISSSLSYYNMFSETTGLTAIYVNEAGKEFLSQYIDDIGLTDRDNLLQVKA